MEKTLILWTGGWDSTYLILDAIDKNIQFETCYFLLENNKAQQKRELKNRRKLHILINDAYGVSFKDNVYRFTTTLDVEDHVSSTQPFIWLNSLVWNIDTRNYNEIWFGYLKTSHVFHIREAFIGYYEYGIKLLRVSPRLKGIAELTFPLEWYMKEDVYNNILVLLSRKESHKQYIVNLLTTCEGRTTSVCGECIKCKEIDKVIKDMGND